MNIAEENYHEISQQVRELLFDCDEPTDREENNLLFTEEDKEAQAAEHAAAGAFADEQEQKSPAGEGQKAAPAEKSGLKDAKELWPQLESSHNARALIGRMSELAGDREGRRILAEHPQLMLKLAALDLYGAPASANQKLMEQAKQAGREEALREMASRGAKTARAAAVGKKSPPVAPSLDEQIRQEIYEAGGKGLFG